MLTINNTSTTNMIPVARRPHLAKKIPIFPSHVQNDVSQSLMDKFRGTTPQGRELIRKKLWEVKRRLLAAQAEFDEHWAKIQTLLPTAAFTAPSGGERLRQGIVDHLTQTQQWMAYRCHVERLASAFPLIQEFPKYRMHRATVHFLSSIEPPPAPISSSVEQSGSQKSVFAERSQFVA